MEDSGSILRHLSNLKDLLDKVNNEIEGSIQITREIESEIVKCEEIETAMAAREAELIKLVYLSQFELRGLIVVAVKSRNSVTALMEEINRLRKKKDELLERLNKNRENFIESCIRFQSSIEGEESSELRTLLLEKESLQEEIHKLDQTYTNLKESVSTPSTKILEHLNSSNSALEAEIQRGYAENEQLKKEIDELRTALLSTVNDPW